MKEKPKFTILYTEEAMSFLQSLDSKVQDKIAFNINKCRFLQIKSYSRNLKIQKSGSFELCIIRRHIVFLHFGIRIKRRSW